MNALAGTAGVLACLRWSARLESNRGLELSRKQARTPAVPAIGFVMKSKVLLKGIGLALARFYEA